MANYQPNLDTAFQALADPTRRAVIERLGRGPASVGELAQPFEMALPSFMQHIKTLEQSGILVSQKTGRVRTCHLNPAALSTIDEWMATQRKLWTKRLDQLEAFLVDPEHKEHFNE